MARPKKSTESGSSDSPPAKIETRVRRVRISDLAFLETNARYMSNAEYTQLVENIKRDGALTSLPLVAMGGDAPLTARGKDRLEVVSGNHRGNAAKDAGLEEIDVLEIVTPLTKQQKIAIQLSHNAIVGKGDPNILAGLYFDLDLAWKEYSGLTDDAFKIGDIDVAALSVGALKYQELNILFLPEDEEQFVDLVKRVQANKKRPVRFVARYDDFDRIFDSIVAVKKGLNVHNTAIALRALADLAMERLAQIEAEQKEEGKPQA